MSTAQSDLALVQARSPTDTLQKEENSYLSVSDLHLSARDTASQVRTFYWAWISGEHFETASALGLAHTGVFGMALIATGLIGRNRVHTN
jgi:hypothetical protein